MPPSDTWQQIDDLFARAVELPPEQWPAFLAAADVAAHVRAEVASLLANDRGAQARLRDVVAVAADELADALSTTHVGRQLGPWRIVAWIAEGGMGTVYRAERDDATYRQVVALKLLSQGLASTQAVARFRDERQLLAGLDHPGIVRLLDGGTTPEGLPYLVMEYIEGTPLSEYARGLPIRRRVELVRRICEALQYAHQRLVIHRDIKPSNVMVTVDGAPKLLDFGIAKLLDPGVASAREARTRTGAALFTPEYASPEQALGATVGVATDVYSTGAVLYELLAGRPPHRAGDSVLATLRAICEVEPPRPSAVAPAHRRELVGDLDNIVLTALQKDPAQLKRPIG